MTVACIMQPTYLPWLGYFDMLDQADVFVLLDTVAVSPKSWQTRNRIRARDGNVVWLSVPINAHQGTLLKDVAIANKAWHGKQQRTLASAYRHAPHWPTVAEGLITADPWPFRRLCDLTCPLVAELAFMLGIETRIVRASTLDLPTRADPIERIADICAAVGAQELLNTPGARDFLDGHDVGVPVRWHNYEHPTYSQGDAPFEPFLSVVDLLAWHGPDALSIIRSGRR